MDWQVRYYPLDLFVSLNSRIEDLISKDEFLGVDIVQEEINAVGTPELKAWAKAHRSLFLSSTPDIQVEAATIEAKYPDLTDPKGQYQSADAFVIALARLQGGVVVSQETSVHEKRNPPRNHYIPDVCRDLGISCINILGLMRRENWKF